MYEITIRTHCIWSLLFLTYSLFIFHYNIAAATRCMDIIWWHLTLIALHTSHFMSWGFFCHSHEGCQQEHNQPFWYMCKPGYVRELASHRASLSMRHGNQWINIPFFSGDKYIWLLLSLDWTPVAHSKNQLNNAPSHWLSSPPCFTLPGLFLLPGLIS